jgi:hypothetical protein
MLFAAIDLLLRAITPGSDAQGQSISIASAYRQAALMRAAVSLGTHRQAAATMFAGLPTPD